MSFPLWPHHHDQDNEHTHHSPNFFQTPLSLIPLTLLHMLHWSPGHEWSAFCHYSWDCSFLEFYVNGMIQYVLFFVWLLACCIIILRPIHGFASFLLLLSSIPLYRYTKICLSIHFLRNLTCFHSLAITNKSVTNICAHVCNIQDIFEWSYVFFSLE